MESVKPNALDFAKEQALNAEDKVRQALEAGSPAYPEDLAESTDLALKTVQNVLTRLRKAGEVKDTGAIKGQAREVCLVALPIGGQGRGHQIENRAVELPEKEENATIDPATPPTTSAGSAALPRQDGQKDDVDPRVLEAVRQFLEDRPHFRGESPASLVVGPRYLAQDLFSRGYLDYQPLAHEVAAALKSIGLEVGHSDTVFW